MSSDAPKLGTGLFGFRRSTVEQIMAESDVRLREAEARLRAAEMRVAELQEEIELLRRRNARLDQELRGAESPMTVAGDGASSSSAEPTPAIADRFSRTATKEDG